MNLRELAEASGTPERNIRFLISQGIVPAPDGSRKFASYGDEHVRALAVYSEAKAEGLSLEAIKRRIDAIRRGGPIEREVAPGVVVKVDPEAVPDVEELFVAIQSVVEEMQQRRARREGELT